MTAESRLIPPGFNAEQLDRILTELPRPRVYWVAYSGGCDSSVLLHAMATLAPRLEGALIKAIHVDHGLHADSATWSNHCVSTCHELGLDCAVERVSVDRASGKGLEAAARQARHAALKRYVGADDLLLTAQHRDDQAETVLLQLLRGANVYGVAAMPRLAHFGAGRLARPLLDITRAQIKSYAQHYDLYWVEDPSNFDTALQRNFIRHEIMPRLQSQWPTVIATLAASAERFGDAAQLLDGLAAQDLRRAHGDAEGALAVDKLLQLANPRRNNALRTWLLRHGLGSPGPALYRRIESDLLRASASASPALIWRRGQVRRYRNNIFAYKTLPAIPENFVEAWPLAEDLVLPAGLGRLHRRTRDGGGLSPGLVGRPDVTVRLRQGGESLRPAGRGGRHSLKKLFQENGVPPWWRNRMPLVYVGERLAAVPGIAVDQEFSAQQGEQGLWIEWQC